MGNYVERNLLSSEILHETMKLSLAHLIWSWIKGILFSWLLFIPTIFAIIDLMNFPFTELGVTNKRVIGKIGMFSQTIMDVPLNKIQGIELYSPFVGRIFDYGTIRIETATGTRFKYEGIKNPERFKNTVMELLDSYEYENMTRYH